MYGTAILDEVSYLTMLKRASNVQNLLQYAMPLGKVELTSNNQNFGNVEVTQGLFLGDSLLPLFQSWLANA